MIIRSADGRHHLLYSSQLIPEWHCENELKNSGKPVKSRLSAANKKSARRDSNSPNAGKATKIKEERTLSKVCLQAVYNLEIREESCQGVCGADTFYPFTACYSG